MTKTIKEKIMETTLTSKSSALTNNSSTPVSNPSGILTMMSVLNNSLITYSKLVEELQSRLTQVSCENVSEIGTGGADQAPTSPLATALRGMIHRLDLLNCDLELTIKRIDL